MSQMCSLRVVLGVKCGSLQIGRDRANGCTGGHIRREGISSKNHQVLQEGSANEVRLAKLVAERVIAAKAGPRCADLALDVSSTG